MNFSVKSTNNSQNDSSGSILLLSKTDKIKAELTLEDVRKSLIASLKEEVVRGNIHIVNNALCRFGFIISDNYINNRGDIEVILKDIETVVNNANEEDLDGQTFHLSKEIIEVSGVY